jgi:hypothetical protein
VFVVVAHPPPYRKWLIVVAVILPGMFLSVILAVAGNWPMAALGLGLGVLYAGVLYRRELRALVWRRTGREPTDARQWAERSEEPPRSVRVRRAYVVLGFLVALGLFVIVLNAAEGERGGVEVGVIMTVCGVGVGIWRIDYEKNRR